MQRLLTEIGQMDLLVTLIRSLESGAVTPEELETVIKSLETQEPSEVQQIAAVSPPRKLESNNSSLFDLKTGIKVTE